MSTKVDQDSLRILFKRFLNDDGGPESGFTVLKTI